MQEIMETRWDSCMHAQGATSKETMKPRSYDKKIFLWLNSPNFWVASRISGPGSSVGIATDYGLDGPGIETRWGARFSARPDRPWGSPSLLYNGYRVFTGGKVQPGRDADH